MKTTEHGIEDSKDVENVYHMRLMALLQELVREKGYKGAARVLEIDPQTVTESAKTGQLTRRVRQALERALQEGVGSAAERQRTRNDQLEGRVEALEQGHDELGKEARRRLAAVDGDVAALRRDDGQRPGTTGAGHAGAGPSQHGSAQTEAGASAQGRKPPSKPSMRREYPDLATREAADDDEEIFGEAWPLIVAWRDLKDAHPNEGNGLDWLTAQGASLGGGAGAAGRARDDAAAGEAAAAGPRPERADQLAQDRALRHAESAGETCASAESKARRYVRTLVEVTGGPVRRVCRLKM